MKLYAVIAGLQRSGTASFHRAVVVAGFRHVLVSYAAGERETLAMIVGARHRGATVFLDSGAFSAFTGRARIDVRRYIGFCREVRPLVDAVANLDVIGDRAGTLANEAAMVAAGLDPLVTCHWGDDPIFVRDRFAAGRRGALGAMAAGPGRGRSARVEWLDRVFSVLMASSSWPIAVHGYGITDATVVERFPWASVDSSGWVSVFGSEIARTGRLLSSRRDALGGAVSASVPSTSFLRAARTGRAMVSFADYVTCLWRSRGVEWPA